MKLVLIVSCAIAFFSTRTEASVLTQEVLELSYQAVKLSALAYANATVHTDSETASGFSHPDFDEITFYTEEPDQAILAKKNGRCYVAFRGTTQTIDDWYQNINPDSADIHKDNDESMESCVVRQGFAEFLQTQPVVQASADLDACVATCTDPNDCLVITGHSQGAASAAVDSILQYSNNPIVITFGMPPAVAANCDLIPSDRFYRFVNYVTEMDEGAPEDVGFDTVPFLPDIFSTPFDNAAVHYGHYLLVGPDKTAAKYLGFNTNSSFNPGDFLSVAAHTLSSAAYSYQSRIEGLLVGQSSFPVDTDGFSEGVMCDATFEEICASDSCPASLCEADASRMPVDDTSAGERVLYAFAVFVVSIALALVQ